MVSVFKGDLMRVCVCPCYLLSKDNCIRQNTVTNQPCGSMPTVPRCLCLAVPALALCTSHSLFWGMCDIWSVSGQSSWRTWAPRVTNEKLWLAGSWHKYCFFDKHFKWLINGKTFSNESDLQPVDEPRRTNSSPFPEYCSVAKDKCCLEKDPFYFAKHNNRAGAAMHKVYICSATWKKDVF